MAEFGARARHAAQKVGSTHPFKGRVAISQVYDEYGKHFPDAGKLDDFKRRLVTSAQSGHVSLGRNDLPESMDKDLFRRSSTPWGENQVHFVNHEVQPTKRADGGKVIGLGAARRGYDGGGVVGPVMGSEALAFDPDALGSLDASMQPGLGVAVAPTGMDLGSAVQAAPAAASAGLGSPINQTTAPVSLAPSGGLGTAALPAPSSQGLGAATNDNAPIPVAAAPSHLAAAQPTGGGLGAIAAAAPTSGAPLGGGFGFDRSVNRTLGFEGGLNASDTNGTPSNFGINQAANPDVDVTKMTADQAKGIYKSRYWDAIGADKLSPARLAHVAFDTAVMAGPSPCSADDRLSRAAIRPNSWTLRDGYLSGLLQSDPDKYGKYAGAWSARGTRHSEATSARVVVPVIGSGLCGRV